MELNRILNREIVERKGDKIQVHYDGSHTVQQNLTHYNTRVSLEMKYSSIQ